METEMETVIEIKTNSIRMYPVIFLYDTHTKYFTNVIEGIKDEDAQKRLDTKANHIAWLAGSLVYQRFIVTKLLGKEEQKQKSYDLFKDFQGIQDNVKYPPLSEYQDDWNKISPIVRDLLANVSDEKLDSIFEMPGVPEMTMPHLELIMFNMHREAYLIGQIGLWRRLLGYPAMKYN